MDLWLVLFGAVFALLCFVLHQRGTLRFLYLTTKIPGPSIWNLLKLAKPLLIFDEPLDTLSKLIALCDYKPFGVWITHKSFKIMVSDPETASQVFTNKDFADKPDFMYVSLGHYIGENYFVTNGERVRRVKRTIEPTFKKRFLELHLPRINGEAAGLAEELRTMAGDSDYSVGDSVDVRRLIHKRLLSVSLSVISSGTFSMSYSLTQEWLSFAHEVVRLTSIRSIKPYTYWLLHRHKASSKQLEKGIETFVARIKHLFVEEIRARRDRDRDMAQAQADEQGPRNIMDSATSREPSQLASQTGQGFLDDEEAANEIIFVLIAASETTATTLNICLLLLAVHQDLQERAFREVESVLGDRDEAVPGDLTNMLYLDQFIKEALRLFPVGPFVGKRAVRETKLNGFTVPKGTTIAVSIWSIHRNPKVHEEPLKFDPERFSSGATATPPFSWIPFSHGNRKCPGQWLGMCMLKIFLSHIMRNFRILPGDGLGSIHDIKVAFAMDLLLLDSSLRFIPRKMGD